ncbi:MAG: hypothetical protein JKY37_16325 [Nannocystaceae bacterium]|nr:hypothetical protein [Nannocystaceae bacterium]
MQPVAHDPNDAPPMRAPHGQPQHDQAIWRAPLTDRSGRRRRVALTLQPAFAAWRLAFIGRPTRPIRGLGVIADLDVQVWRTLWLRVSASHTVHPLEAAYTRDEENDDEIVKTAASGMLQSTGVALGAAYAFDLGRVLPLIEAGVGGFRLSTPTAVQDGQRGGECLSDGTCDAGLRRGASATCQIGVLPELHAGLGVDVLLAQHWSVGAGLRYYALLSAPGVFPIYLTGTARLGVRW